MKPLFAKLDVQEKVNDLSHRGEGKPQEPDDEYSVASGFKGQFKVAKGIITLSRTFVHRARRHRQSEWKLRTDEPGNGLSTEPLG